MLTRMTAAAFGLAALLLLPHAALATQPPLGVWTSQKRDVRVRLSDCGGNICGTLVWLQQSIDPRTGRPKTDRLNPDPVKRDRPLIGIQVAYNFVPSGTRQWTGTIYNADDGHRYRAHLIVLGPRTIRLEGCMLVVLCMGHTWRRVHGSGIAGTAGTPPAAANVRGLRALLRGAL